MFEQKIVCVCTYSPDVSADHEADVFGEGMNQLEQRRTRVRVSRHDQTLRPVNKDVFLNHQTLDWKEIAGVLHKSRIPFNFLKFFHILTQNCKAWPLANLPKTASTHKQISSPGGWCKTLGNALSRSKPRADLKFFTWSSTPVRFRQ